jgi:beta-lactamase class A
VERIPAGRKNDPQFQVATGIAYSPADDEDRIPGAYSPLQNRYPNANVDLTLRELIQLAAGQSDNGAEEVRLHDWPKPATCRLPAGTPLAHKTGSSGTHGGITAATNDMGLITLPDGRRLAIAVLVTDSPADEATREGVIARIARAAYDEAIATK